MNRPRCVHDQDAEFCARCAAATLTHEKFEAEALEFDTYCTSSDRELLQGRLADYVRGLLDIVSRQGGRQ
jgi:hypothetical protein